MKLLLAKGADVKPRACSPTGPARLRPSPVRSIVRLED